MQNNIVVQNSSGNVFADIGMKNPDESLQKAELLRQISSLATIKNITSAQASQILGIDSDRVSDLEIGRATHFSLSELTDFVVRLSN